jgi:excisionase family DNA binding protein
MTQNTAIKTSYVQPGTATSPEFERLLLRGGEVARMLGISRALAFQWMQKGILPTIRVPGGRTVRVPRSGLLEFIEEQTRQGGGRAA